MTFSITEFRDLSFAFFFLYVFFVSKIYLALWGALFHLVRTGAILLFTSSASNYKIVISVYVVVVLIGYLYKFRTVLTSKEKSFDNNNWKTLSSDKKLQTRIGIASLILILINVIAIIFK